MVRVGLAIGSLRVPAALADCLPPYVLVLSATRIARPCPTHRLTEMAYAVHNVSGMCLFRHVMRWPCGMVDVRRCPDANTRLSNHLLVILTDTDMSSLAVPTEKEPRIRGHSTMVRLFTFRCRVRVWSPILVVPVLDSLLSRHRDGEGYQDALNRSSSAALLRQAMYYCGTSNS